MINRKDDILRLRAEGKTYAQIQTELNCSRGTISYHCGDGQKDKSTIRRQRRFNTIKYELARKIDGFLGRTKVGLTYNKRTELHKEFILKIESNSRCYLTGKLIDLSNPDEYSLDHKIPYSVSQDNTINNVGLCTKDANQSKSYLTVENYIQLCKEVLEYNGFKVIKE